MVPVRVVSVVLASVVTLGVAGPGGSAALAAACTRTSAVVVIPLTGAKHGQLIAHAVYAIRVRHFPRILVLHRSGAEARRKALLKPIPVKAGYDRDEYPPAAGRAVVRADVRYVSPTQNRSGGAVMGNRLRKYCDGVKFRYAGT